MSTTSATRIIKHRSSKACQSCRTRKVRCDIVLRKDKCTNCCLDNLDCVQPGPRRRRGTGRGSKKPRAPNPTEPEITVSDSCSPVHDARSVLPDPVQTSKDTLDPATILQEQSLQTVNTEDGQPIPDSNEDLFPDFTGDLHRQQAPSFSVQPTSDTPNFNDTPFQNLQKLLPAWAAPICSQRTHLYADFLHTQGAFKIPPPRLLRALLTRYAECVYPQLPVVDIHHVLQAVATDGTEGRVSFVLLLSMLLAASPFVDAQYLSEAGYQNRMALRRELAERVRLLYDFDCETDRLVLVQSLILMTSWQDKGDEVKHLRHWLSIASNIAFLLGLNKEVPARLNCTGKYKSLRKRIWWSLYMRDRTLSLGLRQWPIIAVDACEISEPDFEDFDVHPASAEICGMLEDCHLLLDLDQQIRLTEVFRAQLQLSHKIYEVFRARYTVVTPKLGSTRMIALVLVPKVLDHAMPEVHTCSGELDTWFKMLPDNLRYRTPLSLCFGPGQDVLALHSCVLNLFYYALVCALHRPYPFPQQRELPASERSLHRKARHAANAIFSILEEFMALDMVCFMPTQGITFMLQGAVTMLCDTTSTVAQLRSQSHRSLRTCLDILRNLSDVHSYAPYATNFLTAAAVNIGRQSQIHQHATDPSPSQSPSQSQTSPPVFRPGAAAGVQAPPDPPFVGNQIGPDDLASETGPAVATACGQCDHSDVGLPEITNHSDWIDPSFDCEAVNAQVGWEFFLDLPCDLG